MVEEAEQNIVIIAIKSFFLCLFIIIAVVGNCSVLYVIRHYKKLKTIPNLFVFNLAIADLLFALTGMPMILVTTIAKGWILGGFLCNVSGFLNTFTCTTSIWTLVMISLHRYFAVAKASEIKRIYTRRRTYIILALVWLFAFAISIPPVFGWSKFIAGSNFCTIDGKSSMSYSVFVLALDYFIPFFIMVGLYITIFVLLRKHEQNMRKSRSDLKLSNSVTMETSSITSDSESASSIKDYAITRNISKCDKKVLALYVNTKIDNTIDESSDDVTLESNNTTITTEPVLNDNNFKDGNNFKDDNKNNSKKSVRIVISHDVTDHDTESKFKKPRKSKRGSSVRKFFKEMRVTKMLLIVVLGFFFCWTPFLVSSILYAFNAAPDDFELLTLGIMFACMNSIINPIIYALMNKNFRNAFHTMYLRLCSFICNYQKNN